MNTYTDLVKTRRNDACFDRCPLFKKHVKYILLLLRHSAMNAFPDAF